MLQRVELLWFGHRSDVCYLVVRFKCFVDFHALVHKIEYEGVCLTGSGTVEARKCLHRLHTGETLINVHSMQKRLVEPCLIFLGDKQNLVFFRRKLGRQLALFDARYSYLFSVNFLTAISGSTTAPENATNSPNIGIARRSAMYLSMASL